MSTRIRKPGDGDVQGSALLNAAADEESEAPFAVREARITTSGLGASVQKLMAQVPLNRSTLAGIGVGMVFVAAIVGLGNVSSDDTGISSPTAGAAGSDGGGSRGQFTDGGLFASEAAKKRSRAAGAAGKEAALAGQVESRQVTGDTGWQSLDDGPAGPATLANAGIDQLGRSDTGNDTDDDVNVGANTSGDTNSPAGADGDLTGGGRMILDSSTATTRTSPGGPVASSTTSRFTFPTSSPTTHSDSGPTATAGQATTTASTTTAKAPPPTSSTTSKPTQPPTTGPPVDNTPLIAAPGNGSSFSLNARVTFNVNAVDGADEYCWTFSGPGVSVVTGCTTGSAYTLRLGDYDFGFGQLTATGEARQGATTLKSGSITLNLVLERVLIRPGNDQRQAIGRPMRIGFPDVSGATRYCYQLRQALYDSDETCLTDNGVTIARNDPQWDQLRAGPLEVTGWVVVGGNTVGRETVTVTLTG